MSPLLFFCGSTPIAGNELNETTEDIVRKRLYSPKSIKKPRFRLEVGETVRNPQARTPFAEAYEGNCTKEFKSRCETSN